MPVAPWRRSRRPPSRRPLRPWQAPLALAIVVNAAALGYHLTQGWDWGDSYWMVLVTISTLGFSDPHTQVLNAEGRVVTALLIAGGLVVVQLTIQALLGLSESGYYRRIRERRFRSWLSTMHNHVILCGYGRIGREIGEQLAREGVPLLVVEMDPERQAAAEERGLPVVMADATLDETLIEAGIYRCRSLVAALPSNAANLYVVLSARGLAPQCRLIARSDSDEAGRKLRQAGADAVVSPYVSGGRTMAATALRPLAVTFMDLLAGSDCEVEEFQLSSNSEDLGKLAGASLAEVQLGRRTGALVLAIVPSLSQREGDGDQGLIANPSSDVRLEAGQMLVVMGSKEQLERVEQLLGPALKSVDAMAN
ncbi:TrkA family potassium uptake protein [Cyanobium sp. WAJ14-Wanaka]|uniref:potassium channel family protein n=1 Tax=Cyanobium sp. WAJ14-Wanaka TaxID=2823725 RepID=UPI0020CD9810|nr:potassium channel protein [Cyanobium sp. WAJ14-Wanaka]MCP9774925.1 potassium channel protein [Cyanobium sp. WAJ14-Wanaka]